MRLVRSEPAGMLCARSIAARSPDEADKNRAIAPASPFLLLDCDGGDAEPVLEVVVVGFEAARAGRVPLPLVRPGLGAGSGGAGPASVLTRRLFRRRCDASSSAGSGAAWPLTLRRWPRFIAGA